MPAIRQILLVLKRIAIVFGIFVAFTLGLFGAIYLSLRSSETKVPDIIGKDRQAAENTISDAGLNFRVRARRATSEAKPDTVLIQLPPPGQIVKVGQTVAVDISLPSANGESSPPANSNTESSNANKPENTTADNSNGNANKEKKKPANRNANANANSNRAANRNLNINRANANAGATPLNTNSNSTATPPRPNPNRNGNVNVNRRPATAAPTP